jgi:hypothetical protein
VFWLSSLLLIAFLSPGEARTRQDPSADPSELAHVRSTDAELLLLLRDGGARSPTLQSLLRALGGTDTIVYVERGICGFGHFKACLPHAIAASGSTRFLRILIDPHERGPRAVSLIAHELQHAFEIAAVESVRSADDVTALFRRIGRSPHCPGGTPDCFETSAARAVGIAVLDEMLASLKPAPDHR